MRQSGTFIPRRELQRPGNVREVRVSAAHPDDYFLFGDVYETLDACHQVDLLLSRLRRQSLLDDQNWIMTRAHIAEVRKSLESMLKNPE